jgi:predicted RNase H-like HicB family nuclease
MTLGRGLRLQRVDRGPKEPENGCGIPRVADSRFPDGEDEAMKYKIILRRSEEGYSVSVPGLPGCWSQGDTEEEAIENIKDAVQEYLAARNDLFQDAEIREIEVAF